MAGNVPPAWAELMVKKGFTDGRYRNVDVPSIEKLATEARRQAGGGNSPSTFTVSNLIFNRRTRRGTSPEVVEAVRLALGLPHRRMQELISRRVGESDFTPHPSARLMSDTQKRIVNQVIAEFAREAGEVSVDEHKQEPTKVRHLRAADAKGSQSKEEGRGRGRGRKPKDDTDR